MEYLAVNFVSSLTPVLRVYESMAGSIALQQAKP
jgi:hypothetical protein